MDSKLIDKLIEQQEQVKAMQENEDSAIKVMKMYEDCKKRIDRAIEYIDRRDIEWGSEEHNKLLSILKGEDK